MSNFHAIYIIKRQLPLRVYIGRLFRRFFKGSIIVITMCSVSLSYIPLANIQSSRHWTISDPLNLIILLIIPFIYPKIGHKYRAVIILHLLYLLCCIITFVINGPLGPLANQFRIWLFSLSIYMVGLWISKSVVRRTFLYWGMLIYSIAMIFLGVYYFYIATDIVKFSYRRILDLLSPNFWGVIMAILTLYWYFIYLKHKNKINLFMIILCVIGVALSMSRNAISMLIISAFVIAYKYKNLRGLVIFMAFVALALWAAYSFSLEVTLPAFWLEKMSTVLLVAEERITIFNGTRIIELFARPIGVILVGDAISSDMHGIWANAFAMIGLPSVFILAGYYISLLYTAWGSSNYTQGLSLAARAVLGALVLSMMLSDSVTNIHNTSLTCAYLFSLVCGAIQVEKARNT